MKCLLILWVCLSFFNPRSAYAFTLSGFDSPDSMIIDPDTGAYFVSNVVGSPSAKDGNGYISKITANGNILIQKYIGGKPGRPVLDAPKGLQLAGDLLYVVDIDSVKVFDKTSALLVRLIDLSSHGATHLDDITMDPSGNFYVSDRMSHRIFKIIPSKSYAIDLISSNPALGEPTGLTVNPRTKNLMVVTYGTGRILEIDQAGRVHTLKRGLRGLSGIDHDAEGNLYVSSHETSEVYKIPFYGRGVLSTYMSDLAGPTDVAYDRKKQELLIPSSIAHTAATYPRTKNTKPRQRATDPGPAK